MGALLLICSAETLFAQIDPGQFIDRNSSSLATVFKNQQPAPGKALQAIKRARADVAERIAGTDAQKRSGVSYLRTILSIHLNDVTTAREHLVEAIARDRGGRYAALANMEMERLQPLQAAWR
jgi:ABC-type transporter Mla subunit MlaD